MGSDRQSILLHENGRKHKENVEQALQQKRDDRVAQDKAKTELQRTLAAMNSAAVSSHLQDVGQYGASALHSVAATATTSSHRPAATAQQNVRPQQPTAAVLAASKERANQEKAAWEMKKKMRDEEKKRKREGSDGSDDDDDDGEQDATAKRQRRQLAPDEGNYTLEEKVYLEGVTFVDLLEDDMPIQIWLGPTQASMAEKRLPHEQHQWCNGLIVKVRRSSQEKETGRVLDIAYLQEKDGKDDEAVEKSVPPNRVRLLLGGDPSIPDTMEEARIAATGGQVLTVKEPADVATASVDENTGLSTWGTIEIRQTTVRQELKEERERARQKRRDEAKRLEDMTRTVEGRRMEEARVDNAEDSALGAYDVWNTAGQTGYKGVNIHSTEKMTAADAAGTSLSGGKKVEFKKKSAFKKKGKKQNRRTTSADDL
jgi:WW domain-binding protein 4